MKKDKKKTEKSDSESTVTTHNTMDDMEVDLPRENNTEVTEHSPNNNPDSSEQVRVPDCSQSRPEGPLLRWPYP